MARFATLLYFLLGTALGGGAGFVYGTQFDLRSEVDWTAVGAVASFLVVVVALVPIWTEYLRTRRRATATRDHALSLLIPIESLLHLRITTPAMGPFNSVDAAPVHELFSLIPQLHPLEAAEARHVTVAAGRVRMLVLLNASPTPGPPQQEFQECSDAVARAVEVLRKRTEPTVREA